MYGKADVIAILMMAGIGVGTAALAAVPPGDGAQAKSGAHPPAQVDAERTPTQAKAQGNNRGYVVGKGGVARLHDADPAVGNTAGIGVNEPGANRAAHAQEIGVNEPGVNRAIRTGGQPITAGGAPRKVPDLSSSSPEHGVPKGD